MDLIVVIWELCNGYEFQIHGIIYLILPRILDRIYSIDLFAWKTQQFTIPKTDINGCHKTPQIGSLIIGVSTLDQTSDIPLVTFHTFHEYCLFFRLTLVIPFISFWCQASITNSLIVISVISQSWMTNKVFVKPINQYWIYWVYQVCDPMIITIITPKTINPIVSPIIFINQQWRL